jgi:hypothetical protein
MIENTTENVKNRLPGRPKGAVSKSKEAALVSRLVTANRHEFKQIIENTIALARCGEPWAVTALMDRIWPKSTGRVVSFPMPHLTSVADMTAALDALLQACAAGSRTPTECNALSAVVSRTGEQLAAKGVEERLQRLESASSGKELTYRRVA